MVVIMSNDHSTHIKTGLIFIGVSIAIGVLLYLLFALGVSSDTEQNTVEDQSIEDVSSITSNGDDSANQDIENSVPQEGDDYDYSNYCGGIWAYIPDDPEESTPFSIEIRPDRTVRYEAFDEPPFEVEYSWGNVEGAVYFPYRASETTSFFLGPCDIENGQAELRIDSDDDEKHYQLVLSSVGILKIGLHKGWLVE